MHKTNAVAIAKTYGFTITARRAGEAKPVIDLEKMFEHHSDEELDEPAETIKAGKYNLECIGVREDHLIFVTQRRGGITIWIDENVTKMFVAERGPYYDKPKGLFVSLPITKPKAFDVDDFAKAIDAFKVKRDAVRGKHKDAAGTSLTLGGVIIPRVKHHAGKVLYEVTNDGVKISIDVRIPERSSRSYDDRINIWIIGGDKEYDKRISWQSNVQNVLDKLYAKDKDKIDAALKPASTISFAYGTDDNYKVVEFKDLSAFKNDFEALVKKHGGKITS